MSYGIRIKRIREDKSLETLFSSEDSVRFFPVLIGSFIATAGEEGTYHIPKVFSAYPIESFFLHVVGGSTSPKLQVSGKTVRWDYRNTLAGTVTVLVFL